MLISNSDRVRQLSDWLSDTDIVHLELHGPGASICLQREAGRIVAAHDEPAPAAPAGSAATAGSVGVFLHRHPMHHAALAEAGDTVRAGQVVGLLQIGALLLPVTAPFAGVVANVLVAHGATVGYGARLVELDPLPAAS